MTDKPQLSIEQIRLQVRLEAIEHLLANLYVMIYRASRLTDEEIIRGHDQLRQATRTRPIGGPEPAVSDLLTAEFEAAVEALLAEISALHSAAQRQA